MTERTQPNKNIKSFASEFLAGEGNYLHVVNGGPDQHFFQIHQITPLGLTATMFCEMTDDMAVNLIEGILASIENSRKQRSNLAK